MVLPIFVWERTNTTSSVSLPRVSVGVTAAVFLSSRALDGQRNMSAIVSAPMCAYKCRERQL